MQYLILDGKLHAADKPVLSADNRSFRYGEGIFETLRFTPGGMPLWDFHADRLLQGWATLGMQLPVHFSTDQLKHQITSLVQKNQHGPHARIRMTFFKGDGGLWEEPAGFHYLIQSWPLQELLFNTNGLDIGIYTGAHKSCDTLSNLKSNNYLLYTVAAGFAKQQKWNDCLVLNEHGRIADSTIANIFFIKNGVIHTPALTEAGVAGTMRRYILQQLPQNGYQVVEGAYTGEALLEADEIFLSNAIHGIRWVKQLEDRQYFPSIASAIYSDMILPLFG